MAEPHRAADDRDRGIAQGALFRTILRFAWKMLRSYGLTTADRDDVAQDVAIKAYLLRGKYRAERGSVTQWVSGIVRNEVRDFRRTQSKQPPLASGETKVEAVCTAPTPEESVGSIDLAEHVFEFLPPDERRVVILYEIEGYTFREIAEREGIGTATAIARHNRGMAQLRQAAEDEERRGVVPLPAAFVVALGQDTDASEPPPDLVDRAWRRMAALLGVEQPPQSEPPASGPRRLDPSPARDVDCPPSTRPPSLPSGRAALLRRIGPLVGVVFAGVVGSRMLDCGDRPRDERSPAAVLAAPTPTATPTPSAAPTPSPLRPAPSSAGPQATAATGASAATTRRAPEATRAGARPRLSARGAEPSSLDQFDAEQALEDTWRTALVSGKLAEASSALTEHTRQFPHGNLAASREHAWSQVCALYRRTRPQSGTAEMDAVCAGRR